MKIYDLVILFFWFGGKANLVEIINKKRRSIMDSSVYKIIEVVGSSNISFEDAAKIAVETAAKSLKDLRVAEIKEMDMKIENGKVVSYRVKVNISFKYVVD